MDIFNTFNLFGVYLHYFDEGNYGFPYCSQKLTSDIVKCLHP